jgi:hypothetical protein
LFIVTFEELVSQFDAAMDCFNIHFHTNYAAPAESPAARFSTAEAPAMKKAATPGELRVSRPTPSRSSARKELRQRLHDTPSLQRKLARARKLYSVFVPGTRRVPVLPLNLTTRHLPSLA